MQYYRPSTWSPCLFIHGYYRFKSAWMPHKTQSLLSSRILRLTPSCSIFKSGKRNPLSGFFNFGNKPKSKELKSGDFVGYLRIPIQAAHYRAIWTRRVAKFPVAIFRQVMFYSIPRLHHCQSELDQWQLSQVYREQKSLFEQPFRVGQSEGCYQ